MTPEEHQATVDIAKVAINEYFDHYLSEVFPKQMDRMFAGHNSDINAHPEQMTALFKTKKKVDRWTWMFAGMSALFGMVVGFGPVVYGWLQKLTQPK